MKITFFFLIATLTVLSQKGFAQSACQIPTTEGNFHRISLNYMNQNSNEYQLDLYRKYPNKQKQPLVIYIHGGGWKAGDKRNLKHINNAKMFANLGFLVASFNYPLTKNINGKIINQHGTALRALRCGFRYLIANRERFHIDPERIVLTGTSAGGNLAANLAYATKDDLDFLDGEASSCPYSHIKLPRAIAFIGNSGVYNFALKMKTDQEISGYVSNLYQYFGFTREPANLRELDRWQDNLIVGNVLRRVNRSYEPFSFIIQNRFDQRTRGQAQLLERVLDSRQPGNYVIYTPPLTSHDVPYFSKAEAYSEHSCHLISLLNEILAEKN